MQIIELYIKNFGKFSETRFDLSENLHVFYGENEYGKTTIYAFIKAMLFGMERGRGRAALNDAYSRYEPWENPSYYAGAMRFISGGKRFYLERQFDRYGKKAVLICEDDGEELSVENGDLKMLLEGMTEESFENTAAISALSAKPGTTLSDELKNCAANFYAGGSAQVDLAKALEHLKTKRKENERSIREEQSVQQEKCRQCEAKIEYIENESERLKTQFSKEYSKLEELKKQKNVSSQPEVEGENQKSSMRYYLPAILLCVIALAGIFLWQTLQLPVIVGLCFIAVLAAGAALLVLEIRRKKADYKDGQNIRQGGNQKISGQSQRQDLRDEADILQEMQKLKWECEHFQEEWKEKQVQKRNLEEQLKELKEETPVILSLKKTRQALDLAEEKLKQAADQMKGSFGKHLNDEASKIFFQITEGRYRQIKIDENLDIKVYGERKWIPLARLSRGTQEQLYFALRMAALNLLYEEPLPVIFDDAFAFYDEKRLKSTLKWLWEQPRQVIIFSCQRREKELAERMDKGCRLSF
ncbi:MAG: AAA family ATPase [Ruminococcus sp.]|nr:AAA family ATPase [Ruminococcus sp.]